MKEILSTITLNGYKKKDYGYVKVVGDITHFIKVYDEKLKMYGYFTGDDDSDHKIYHTGIIKVSASELQSLINIFTTK